MKKEKTAMNKKTTLTNHIPVIWCYLALFGPKIFLLESPLPHVKALPEIP